ncbi:MAG: 50S ribosomal protein L2 [Bacteroidetes bacterium]|nr:50S ribosomal protein L2 [Bacteroidota bacterium]
MSVKKIKPTTPSQRFRIAPDFSELSKVKPEKSLTSFNKSKGGRNNLGRMTVRNVGGGHKQKLRIIDFKRNKFDIPAKVYSIEYDPIRTAHIALLHYVDGEKAYIIAPDGLKVGSKIISGESVPPSVGNALLLKNMPAGSTIHNIELKPGKGGAIVRSAGASAKFLGKDGKYVSVKLPSGEVRSILGTCMATIGSVSNSSHFNVVIGKAGRNRWLGKRPRVRGVAMNPVDHPMGGGEGKASGGQPKSRTGVYSKGKKTRKKNKYSDKYILKHRNSKK